MQQADRYVAGRSWQENGLVFCSAVGTELDAANVRRAFKAACEAAGIGRDWTPRELRHTFVSLMSEGGMSTEEIARLVGHASTAVTERIYRKELRPVLQGGAEAMDRRFGSK